MAQQQSNNSDRKQTDLQDDKGRFKKGNTPPAGFNANPQNRHNGAWKKEDTPRYKLEQMMKLSADELRKVAEDKTAPLFEQKLAIAIKNGQWREIKEMIQEVYGKPQENVDLTSKGERLTVVVEDVYAKKPKFRPTNQTTEADELAEDSSSA